MRNIGIVSMMRNPGKVLQTFLDYHRKIGFTRFYILFDDPLDPDLPEAQKHQDVVAVPMDQSHRQEWKQLHRYQECAPYIEHTVGARQVLNTEYGLKLALKDGVDWLLHIDIDELVRVKNNDIQAQIDRLESASIDSATFLNFEAVPDQFEIDNYFHSVSHFKKPIKLLQHQQISRQGIWPKGRQYFNFYNNGKSITKVEPGIVPLGAHRWTHLHRDLNKAVFFNPCILHFSVCGYYHFKLKYQHRGNFSNLRMKKDLKQSGARLDLDARDAYLNNDEDLAKEIYRTRVMMDNQTLVKMLEHKIVQQFDLSRLLEKQKV